MIPSVKISFPIRYNTKLIRLNMTCPKIPTIRFLVLITMYPKTTATMEMIIAGMTLPMLIWARPKRTDVMMIAGYFPVAISNLSNKNPRKKISSAIG